MRYGVVCLFLVLVVVIGFTYTEAQECEPGETTELECNSCKCVDGIWDCRRRFCIRKRAAPECQPGETKKVDCNTCFCANGVFACTKIGCLKKRAAPEQCKPGETKKVNCNDCFCANGVFVCTLKACLSKREAIAAKFNGELSRQKRDAPHALAADLANTPCAPNDYFQVDCNTCYCKIDRSGYLCTENYCQNSFDLSTTSQIPLSNDSMLIISNHGVQLLENLNSNDNSLSRIAKSVKVESEGHTKSPPVTESTPLNDSYVEHLYQNESFVD